MILTRDVILSALDSGDIAIDPFNAISLESASYNLNLHNQIRVFKEGLNEIDIAAVADDVNILVEMTRIIDMNIIGYYLLKPGELVLGMTEEKIRLSRDIAGWLQGRSRFARMGLMIHITASFMQPGSSNRLVFEIYNASRNAIKLRPAIPIAQVIFERCEGNAQYDGAFKDQDKI
jgi:dCTP deaminase